MSTSRRPGVPLPGICLGPEQTGARDGGKHVGKSFPFVQLPDKAPSACQTLFLCNYHPSNRSPSIERSKGLCGNNPLRQLSALPHCFPLTVSPHGARVLQLWPHLTPQPREVGAAVPQFQSSSARRAARLMGRREKGLGLGQSRPTAPASSI